MEEKHELTITWNTIFSFIWVVPLSVTVQYRWRAIQTSRWDFVKGDHDRLIEVKITVIKGKQNRDFDYWPLNIGWPLNMVPLNTDSTVYLSHKSSYKPKRGLISTSRLTRIPLARFLINWALYSCSSLLDGRLRGSLGQMVLKVTYCQGDQCLPSLTPEICSLVLSLFPDPASWCVPQFVLMYLPARQHYSDKSRKI